MEDNEEQFLEVYTQSLSMITSLIKDHNPLVIASVMMAQSLSLYKTTLSEEDYSEMVASIIEKKDRIRTYASRNLH